MATGRQSDSSIGGSRGSGARATIDAMTAPAESTAHEAGRAWVGERTRVAVGPNVHVSGKLIFHEPVRIEGRFRGEVSSADLIVIGEQGSIEGRVRTPRLLVLGELRGDVVGAEHVVVGPRGRVSARINARSLTVSEGAKFEGDVRVGGGGAVIELEDNMRSA